MDPISASTPIDAPREPVFDFLVDLANRPAILGDFVSEYRLERLEPAGVGAAARFRITESGLWMESVIEEADRPHRIAERGRGGRLGRIPIATAWELTVDETEGCVVRLTYWTEPSQPVGARDREADRNRALLSPSVEPGTGPPEAGDRERREGRAGARRGW